MSLTLTRTPEMAVPVITDIRRVPGTASQYLYEVRWLCGCVTTECGNGPDRAQGHRDADEKRGRSRTCYAHGYMSAVEWDAWQEQRDAVTDRCADCGTAVTPEQWLCSACEETEADCHGTWGEEDAA